MYGCTKISIATPSLKDKCILMPANSSTFHFKTNGLFILDRRQVARPAPYSLTYSAAHPKVPPFFPQKEAQYLCYTISGHCYLAHVSYIDSSVASDSSTTYRAPL